MLEHTWFGFALRDDLFSGLKARKNYLHFENTMYVEDLKSASVSIA